MSNVIEHPRKINDSYGAIVRTYACGSSFTAVHACEDGSLVVAIAATRDLAVKKVLRVLSRDIRRIDVEPMNDWPGEPAEYFYLVEGSNPDTCKLSFEIAGLEQCYQRFNGFARRYYSGGPLEVGFPTIEDAKAARDYLANYAGKCLQQKSLSL